MRAFTPRQCSFLVVGFLSPNKKVAHHINLSVCSNFFLVQNQGCEGKAPATTEAGQATGRIPHGDPEGRHYEEEGAGDQDPREGRVRGEGRGARGRAQTADEEVRGDTDDPLRLQVRLKSKIKDFD